MDKSTFMDNPNLPENEPEEITWQDDENRATLFLRSVFVLLSGALILLVEANPHQIIQYPTNLFYLLGMNVVMPISIIWLFFGQGLRSVEWLSDQKYNAWNYGFNFKNWKTHLKWAIALIVMCFVMLTIHSIQIHCDYSFLPSLNQWPSLIALYWFLGICYVWFFCGYLWFGCAQGFGAIATTIIVTLAVCLWVFASPEYTLYAAITALLSSYICWKTRSFAPVLYAILISAPMIVMITTP
jgi:hypothetical protein